MFLYCMCVILFVFYVVPNIYNDIDNKFAATTCDSTIFMEM